MAKYIIATVKGVFYIMTPGHMDIYEHVGSTSDIGNAKKVCEYLNTHDIPDKF